jgi:hypothetical protein
MWRSLGKVQVVATGTPVIATTNETDSAARYPCQTVFFQQVQGNTGKLWICDRSNAVKATGVGVLATIPAPTSVGGVATILPYAQVTIPSAPAALMANQFWIDADNSGEYCQISAVRN